MKKDHYVLLICIICLIVMMIIYYLIKNNYKKIDNITINNNQYEIEQIVSIKMKEETEGGYIYYKTENKELIQQIIEALKKIQIGEKVDLTFSDNGRYYTIEYYDGTTVTYYFQSNYYNKDNLNYETYNYNKLKKINIPKESINYNP